MANEDHLKILKQGTRVWNRWRDNNPDIDIDLSRAPLSKRNLDDANLAGVDLSHADLFRAILDGAKLIDAKMDSAFLAAASLINTQASGASLRKASFWRANLTGADFSHADLTEAKLTLTMFIGTNLMGADLTRTKTHFTTFSANDLSTVRGLDLVQHNAPSSIGIDTIYNSRGEIPEAFLRGAGVPDELITYARSLISQALQFYSCFISYSSKNHLFAERLYADLQTKGVRCWFAPEDLKIGHKIRMGIDESIRVHDKLLLILSKYSVTSDWVEKEVETALEQERKQKRVVLFPIRLDDTVMKIENGWAADIRRSRHIGDFRGWKLHDKYQKGFSKLLRDLKAEEAGRDDT